jgi:hypothetical protein
LGAADLEGAGALQAFGLDEQPAAQHRVDRTFSSSGVRRTIPSSVVRRRWTSAKVGWELIGIHRAGLEAGRVF